VKKKLKIGEYLAKLQAITRLFRALSPSFSSALAKCTRQKVSKIDVRDHLTEIPSHNVRRRCGTVSAATDRLY